MEGDTIYALIRKAALILNEYKFKLESEIGLIKSTHSHNYPTYMEDLCGFSDLFNESAKLTSENLHNRKDDCDALINIIELMINKSAGDAIIEIIDQPIKDLQNPTYEEVLRKVKYSCKLAKEMIPYLKKHDEEDSMTLDEIADIAIRSKALNLFARYHEIEDIINRDKEE